ncbi:MAG: hypothetical protein MUC77_07840 [Chromatiaceae bacterium]|jgi:uncharacterized membrane protein YccC|nr:hypothetical protein [Chromatiaceae bacterium]
MSSKSERYLGDDAISLSRDIKGVLDRVYSGKHAAPSPPPKPKRIVRRVGAGQKESQELAQHLDALRSMREQSQESTVLREQLQELRDQLAAARLLRGQLEDARLELTRHLPPR